MQVTRITNTFRDESIMGPGPRGGGRVFADERVVGGSDKFVGEATVRVKGAMGLISVAEVVMPADTTGHRPEGEAATAPNVTFKVNFEPPAMLPGEDPKAELDGLARFAVGEALDALHALEDAGFNVNKLALTTTTPGSNAIDFLTDVD